MASYDTAFVTGGTGFVGSHLVEHLLESGYSEVRCLIRSRPKWLEGMDITPVRGNLHNKTALRKGCAEADVVFHIAGITRAPTWEPFEQINIEGTRTLLQIINDLDAPPERTLLCSTLAVVGTGTSGVASEDVPLEPVSRYGKSKAIMEQLATQYCDRFPITIVRPSSVYGPRDEDILSFFRAVHRWHICPIVGDDEHPRISLIHGRDLARGLLQAAEHPEAASQTYNLGSEKPYAWEQLKEATCEALNTRALTVNVPPFLVPIIGGVNEAIGKITGHYPPLTLDKAREIRSACAMCSVAKAQTDFGFSQTIPLDQGVRDTIAWYEREGWLS